jgi:hypothetical protein
LNENPEDTARAKYIHIRINHISLDKRREREKKKPLKRG